MLSDSLHLPHRKPGKKLKYFFWVLCIVLAVMLIRDVYEYPLQGRSYDILKIQKNEIAEAQIWHYGRTLCLRDSEKLNTVLELFDCNVQRYGGLQCGCAAGGDWSVSFLTTDGRRSRAFVFSPADLQHSESPPTSFQIGSYSYQCDVKFDACLLEKYWEEEFRTEK